MPRPVIAVTTGEPAGIGPEIALMALLAVGRHADRSARGGFSCRHVLIGDRDMIAARAARIGLASPEIELVDYTPDGSENTGSDGLGQPVPHIGNRIEILHCPLAAQCVPGRPDPRNGRAVLAMLDRAIDGAVHGEFAAIVTAPVQKSVINEAGIPFSGHTEYLAARTGTQRVVMMLTGGGMRVALATTHLALKDVPDAVTRDGLVETLRIVDADLRGKFGISAPRILVAGLNPHAGEGGYLGREEIDIIVPAIAAACAAGIDAQGPYPADTLFQAKYLDHCDAVLAMYHDQGLPVLKHASFGHGVNVTLGLPVIRTSVDHGTALDLVADAGRVRGADPGSMIAALELAETLAARLAAPDVPTNVTLGSAMQRH